MLVIQDILVSDEISNIRFSCDLEKCFGSCCVEGDAGAPLDENEIGILQEDFEYYKEYMTPEGIREVEKNGVFDFDEDGTFVTPLINDAACAFIRYDNKIAKCAIEKAWEEGKTDFRKPISCHLYPIRIIENKQMEGVNYHKWHICQPARTKGKKEGVPLYKYLKEPLIRKYGKKWYELLVKEIEE